MCKRSCVHQDLLDLERDVAQLAAAPHRAAVHHKPRAVREARNGPNQRLPQLLNVGIEGGYVLHHAFYLVLRVVGLELPERNACEHAAELYRRAFGAAAVAKLGHGCLHVPHVTAREESSVL